MLDRLKRKFNLSLKRVDKPDNVYTQSSYPSQGLNPKRLANIFKEADAGDVMRQMELFEEIEEKDAHLFSQLQTRKNAVCGLDFEVIPFSDAEADKQIAEFVTQEMAAIEEIENVFFDILDAIGKGISVSEILWKIDRSGVHIQKIEYVHPKKLYWDSDNTLKLITRDCPQGTVLQPNKFITHKYKAKSGHPSRAGILRVVSWMYLFKNYDIKDWVTFAEVFGMPLKLGTYNQGASEDDKAALMRALVNLASDAAAIKPEGTEIDIIEASKTSSNDVYESLARYCDEQMSKAILGQTLTSDTGESGSYAQSKTHNEVRHDLLAADCKALASTLRRDLIGPLVMFNFGVLDRLPYIRFACEEAEDLKQTADIYKILINDIGIDIPKAHIHKKFSIPEPENGEAIATPRSSAPTLAPSLIANKLKTPIDNQNDIDKLSSHLTETSGEVFEKMFEPLVSAMNEAESFEALKAVIENDEKLKTLYGDMSDKGLSESLHLSMLLADLAGRTIDE